MSSTFAKIDNIVETFLSTLKRFPLSSIATFLVTIILINLIDRESLLHNSPNTIMASKIAFVSTLAIVLFPALRLLSYHRIVSLLGLPLIAGYYYLLPHNIDDASQLIFIRHVLLIVALLFMIIWAPFVGRESNNTNFWQWTQEIIFGLITAAFFGLVFFAGVAGAMYAIETLFHVDIRSVRYGQVAMFSFGLFSVIYFLSQIPRHPLFLEARPYSKVKRIFSKSILGGFALLYFVILYTYTAKILLTQNYPSGQLSWIIVIFSLVAIVTFLFWTPFLNKKSTLLQRFIWLVIFLQTIMLALALYMRVIEYGITYNRYLVGMFGIWLGLMSLYFMLFGKAQQKWLFFFASLFIVISQFGPYSATVVTKKSQTTRLLKLIEEAKPISEKLEMKTKYQISDAINYINQNYGTDAFKEILPNILEKFKIKQEENKVETDGMKVVIREYAPYLYNFPNFATNELGFKFVDQWQWRNYTQKRDTIYPQNHHFYRNQRNELIDAKGYDYLLNYQFDRYIDNLPYVEKNVSVQLVNNHLEVKSKKALLASFDLNNFAKELKKEDTIMYAPTNVPSKLMIFEEEQNNIKIKVIAQRVIISDNNITDLSSQILLKI